MIENAQCCSFSVWHSNFNSKNLHITAKLIARLQETGQLLFNWWSGKQIKVLRHTRYIYIYIYIYIRNYNIVLCSVYICFIIEGLFDAPLSFFLEN